LEKASNKRKGKASKRKTKKDRDAEDREEARKWLETLADLLKAVPPEMYFGVFLSFLWAQTHGKTIPNKGDLILGMLGGFTVPPGLRAGALSIGGVWSGTYLAALGYNYFDDQIDSGKVADLLLYATGPSGLAQAAAEAFVDATERDPVHKDFEIATLQAGGIFHKASFIKLPGVPYSIVPPKAEMPPGTHAHGDKTIYWQLDDWYNCVYRVGGTFNFYDGTCPIQ